MTIDKSVYEAIEVAFEAVKRFGKPHEAVLTDIAGKSFRLNGFDYDGLIRILGQYPFWDLPPEGDAKATLKELFRDNDFRLETRWAIEKGTGTLTVAIETRRRENETAKKSQACGRGCEGAKARFLLERTPHAYFGPGSVYELVMN